MPTLAVLTSRYMWLSMQDLHKVRPVRLPMDKGEAPEALPPCRGTAGSCWLLREGESLSFGNVAAGRLLMAPTDDQMETLIVPNNKINE